MKTPRLALPDGPERAAVRARRHRPELAAAFADAHAAAMRLDGLDRETTELVRLRCAEYHDCDT
jgi:hypothetical protein